MKRYAVVPRSLARDILAIDINLPNIHFSLTTNKTDRTRATVAPENILRDIEQKNVPTPFTCQNFAATRIRD